MEPLTDDELKARVPGYLRSGLRDNGKVLWLSVPGRTVEVRTTGRRPVLGNGGVVMCFARPGDYDRVIALLEDQ